MVNGGLAFAVPGLLTGLELGTALGLEQSIYVFFLGGLILSILGVVTGLVGMHSRLSSCMTMKFVFGKQGANVLSFAFVVALLGWYGVNIDLFSSVTQRLLLDGFNISSQIWLLEIIFGVVVTLTTILGFKLLDKLSSLFVPIMFLLVVYMVYQSINYDQTLNDITTTAISFSFGEAVSIVVGSFIVSVVLMPDFTRFSASQKDTTIASFLPFLGLSTFVYIASAFAGLAVMESDILKVMLALGLGWFAFALLILSSWVTNVVNLYSSALGLSAINPKWQEWKVIVVAGLLGTVVATFNLLNNFTDFLFGLSIIFVPVASIYVTDFFILRNKKPYQIKDLKSIDNLNVSALIAWFIGMAVTLFVNKGYITLTTIEVCDAILVTTPLYYFLSKRIKRNFTVR